MRIRINIIISIILFILFLNMISAFLNISLSDHGSNIKNSTGALLTSGNLTVLIYDSLSGGNLIYNETFTNVFSNGSWNIMLGENSSNPLALEFGKIYYKDYLINGANVNFTNLTGQNIDRQFFYSPLGDISGEYINASTNITTSGNITSNWFFGKISNVTFIGNVTSNLDFCIVGGKCLSSNTIGTESDPLWTANITNYFTKAQWNVTNTSYALNQTLADMWNSFLNTTNLSYLLIDQFNVTNISYMLIDNWNVTNISYRTLDNVTFIGNGTFTTDICVAGGNCMSAISAAGNASWNQSYASAELYFTKAQWNVTNTSYLLIDQFNATNASYALNQTLTDIWGDIFAGNASWNQSYASAELYFTKAQWNATNTSYALNQTLTDMWTNFLTTTNTSYLMIDKWNATNASYALNQTLTDMWTNFLTTTNTSYLMIDKFNVTNTSYLLIDQFNATNASYALNQTLTDMWTNFLSTTNASYLMIDKFNATNASYALNQTLVDMWTNFLSTTNTSYLMIDKWNATNASYALNQTLTDMWTSFLGATNTTYRTKYNLTWVGNLNSTGTIYSEGINNLTI
ncbi:MAG: hypothetical protein ABIH65_02835, partial [Nanoarchaeota archaeon]